MMETEVKRKTGIYVGESVSTHSIESLPCAPAPSVRACASLLLHMRVSLSPHRDLGATALPRSALPQCVCACMRATYILSHCLTEHMISTNTRTGTYTLSR